MSASNEELASLKTVFKGFTVEYKYGSYYISHEERKIMHELSRTLREKNIKQDNSLQMAMVDFVFEYTGNPCITFEKNELPLLEEHTFDAESFLLQLQKKEKEKMSAGSRNTYSSYAASSDSEGRSPGMWTRPRPPKGTSAASFEKRPTPGG